MLTRIACTAFLTMAATPAAAAGVAQVPEGSSAALFALGVLGVIVGRQLSMRKKDRDE